MHKNLQVPTLDVLIRSELRGGVYPGLGGLAPGFDRTLLDFLEGMTGVQLVASLISQNPNGYTLGVNPNPKGKPVLNINHVNQAGVVKKVQADNWENPLVVDLNEITPQSRRALVTNSCAQVLKRRLDLLILVNTDGEFVKPELLMPFNQIPSFKLVERHVGQGSAFPSIVGQMLLANGIVLL